MYYTKDICFVVKEPLEKKREKEKKKQSSAEKRFASPSACFVFDCVDKTAHDPWETNINK